MGGQKCSALSRLYVHRQVAEPLIDEAARRSVAALPYRRSGAPRELAGTGRDRGPATTTTRATARQLRERWRAPSSAAASSCATVRWRAASSCGRRSRRRRPRHPLWQQEMFLPILMLHRVAANDEAMRLANASPLGLTAGFYGGERRDRLVPGAHRGGRHLRQPAAGRHHRRVARATSPSAAGRARAPPARPSPPSTTCPSTCASSRRPWSSERMRLLPLARGDRDLTCSDGAERRARGLHPPHPLRRRSRDHPPAAGATCT